VKRRFLSEAAAKKHTRRSSHSPGVFSLFGTKNNRKIYDIKISERLINKFSVRTHSKEKQKIKVKPAALATENKSAVANKGGAHQTMRVSSENVSHKHSQRVIASAEDNFERNFHRFYIHARPTDEEIRHRLALIIFTHDDRRIQFQASSRQVNRTKASVN
jgi:hypothetical protein